MSKKVNPTRGEISESLPKASDRVVRSLSELFVTLEFLPVVAGSATEGTAVYTQQYGAFYRQGDFIHLNISLEWTGHTGAGDLQVIGLPEAAKNSTPVTVLPSGVTFVGTASGFIPQIQNYIVVGGVTSGSDLLASTVPSSGALFISAIYQVA